MPTSFQWRFRVQNFLGNFHKKSNLLRILTNQQFEYHFDFEMKFLLILIHIICLSAFVSAAGNGKRNHFTEEQFIQAKNDLFSEEAEDISVDDVYYNLQHLERILWGLKELDTEKESLMKYVQDLLDLQKVDEKRCTCKYYQKVGKLVRESRKHDRPVDLYVNNHVERLYNYCKDILDTLYEPY